jgi:cation transport regulator ChaB
VTGSDSGVPGKEELPDTLKRSPKKAQSTWIKAHDSAVETYGEGEAAHRVAFAALKHSFEKVGDHWEPKKRKGPSDARARAGGPDAKGETFGGVDVVGHTREELIERAKSLGITGVSKMNKAELARAISEKQ